MSGPAPESSPRPRERSFASLALVYGALYCAFGSESPFLPSFLAERGLAAGQIGLLLAFGTLVRIAAGPAVGIAADRTGRPAGVLAISAFAAAAISFGYLLAPGPWTLAAVVAFHSIAIAGLAPISDAIALAFARRDGFSYGAIRGLGSAAFVAGTLVAGQIIPAVGLSGVIGLSAVFFGLMGGALLLLPPVAPDAGTTRLDRAAILRILTRGRFLLLVLTGSLILGSHALNDAFGVIRWREAGIGEGTISVLWSTSVVSEVVVFFLLGPPLLARLGPGPAMMLGATAAAIRWIVTASTTAVPALAAAQFGHGLTFGLVHLAAMRIIAETVPPAAAATAQTVYGTFGLGIASAILTWGSGILFARLGADAYYAMTALCLAALPFGFALRSTEPRRTEDVSVRAQAK